MPVVRLLSVFAKVKEKSVSRKNVELEVPCRNCKYHGPFLREKRWTQLSFLSFPFLVKNRRFTMICPKCKYVAQEVPAHLFQYLFWFFI